MGSWERWGQVKYLSTKIKHLTPKLVLFPCSYCNDFTLHFASDLLTTGLFLCHNMGRSSGWRSMKYDV
jgi:hypothetical protein